MADDSWAGASDRESAWVEHNISQLRYFRSLSLRTKLEAVQGMADVIRRFREMRSKGQFNDSMLSHCQIPRQSSAGSPCLTDSRVNATMPMIGYSLGFARDIISEKMKPYGASLPPIYLKYSGRYLALGGIGKGVEHLAGDWGPRAIMFGQFPTAEAVRQFWWSPEYRAAALLRKGAVNVDVCVLEGLAPPDRHEGLLILAVDTRGGAPLPQTLTALAAGMPDCAVLVAQQNSAIDVLEGDLRGCGVAVLSFESADAPVARWPVIAAMLERAGYRFQSFAVRRMRP